MKLSKEQDAQIEADMANEADLIARYGLPADEPEPIPVWCNECGKPLDYDFTGGYKSHDHRPEREVLSYSVPYTVRYRNAEGFVVKAVTYEGDERQVLSRMVEAFDQKSYYKVKDAVSAELLFLNKSVVTIFRGSFVDWSVRIAAEARQK